MIYRVSDMDLSVVIPITFWSNSQPNFRISSICVAPSSEKLVTGSHTGQLCIWDLNLKSGEITPKNILIGHKHSVTCVVCTNEFVISSCEGGEMFRWNLDDGYCSKTRKSHFVHRKMQLFRRSHQKDELLFACGDYSEIFVIHPFTLQVIHILYSKSDFDWISSFHVVPSINKKSDIVSGITINGCAKLWVIDELVNNLQYEIHSNTLQVEHVVDIKYNQSRTDLLIVSAKYWMMLDSELSNYMHKVEALNKEKLLGGDFCDSNVVVWTNLGKFYIYNITKSKPELISIFLDDSTQVSLFEPTMSIFITPENEKYLIQGDSLGKINIWKMNSHTNVSHPKLSVTLKDKWIFSENSFFSSFINYTSVTCCIYILELDKFIVGCFDGTLVVIPAMQSIMSFYFHSTTKKPSVDILLGHTGKINCLLYPYEKYSYFDKTYLVSGSSDFTVCLWDIVKYELLYKFCIQSGEIIKLMLPPENCSTNVKHSICSVSADHSVAILNLKDRKCVILTSRHEFPIVTVNWKPLDDFIIIECFDGSVYVWQMETGHLDRILNGVTAQEVVYACKEPEAVSPCNFYINKNISRKNSVKRSIFQVQEIIEASNHPLLFSGFLMNEKSESHIFAFNVERIIAQMNLNLESKQEVLESKINDKIYVLTQALGGEVHKKPSTLLEKIKHETEHFHEKFQYQRNDKTNTVIDNSEHDMQKSENSSICCSDKMLKIIQFFLSALHIWGLNQSIDELFSTRLGLLKPDVPPSVGILSQSGIYSLFLPSNQKVGHKSPSLTATTCMAMIILVKIFKSLARLDSSLDREKLVQYDSKDWGSEIYSFYEQLCANNELAVPKPKIEIIAKAWQTKCLVLQNTARTLLSNHLQALGQKESADLLEFWYNYLPHFKIIDKTSSEKVDFENLDFKTVALVLFGTAGSDNKFKDSDSAIQENYAYHTCASLVYLMLLPNEQKSAFSALTTIAIDFLGRGYILWEQFIKLEKVVPVLFQMCLDFSKISLEYNDVVDKCHAAHNALKSIAIARTAAFINLLLNEINQIRLGQSQNNYFLIEKYKPEILSIFTFLLEKTPYIMLLYLNDVISIFVYCIDFSHLKQKNLANLIPVMQKFRQVHHSVASQKIAVGLATGTLVLHDLKTKKAHEVSAHKDSISALKFSEDGKSLVSYSCYENRISFWQVLTGIFGLGHTQVKCTKSCQTYQIHDEEIRNHLEIASLTWTDKKSVVLCLCDGTQTIFQS